MQINSNETPVAALCADEQTQFTSNECGHEELAEVVEAKNILERGHHLIDYKKSWITKLCEEEFFFLEIEGSQDSNRALELR